MHRTMILIVLTAAVAGSAGAQGIASEILSGKLIKPEVGVYAWYDLKDYSVRKRFRLRQAVVGKERLRFKTGYWLETQIIPEVGFPAVYKMLLTGPASDPKNVHRIIFQEGQRPPAEIEVRDVDPGVPTKNERKFLGKERISLAEGTIMAEHFKLSEDGTEIWINKDVRPMGIVKFRSPQGELTLLRYGKGGPDGESVLNAFGSGGGEKDGGGKPGEARGGRINVKVSTGDKDEESHQERVKRLLEERRRR